jgi:hypothetical protein
MFNKKSSQYFNVRLTDGKEFYKGISQAVGAVIANSELPAGAATSEKQDTQVVLATQIETLVETLQELVQRLSPLASAIANTQQLRTVTTGTVTASGPITSSQSIAEKNVGGVLYTTRVATETLTATIANINNCIVT